MSEDPQPIACRMDALTAAERDRRGEVLETLRRRLIKVTETDDGIAFHLPDEVDIPGLIREFLSFESRCCPFLLFGLEGHPPGPLILRLGGGPGVKEFLMEAFRQDLGRLLSTRIGSAE